LDDGTAPPLKSKKGSFKAIKSILSGIVRLALTLSCLLLLCGYGERTYRRNWDWLNDEALFISANEVCSQSAKVQLNTGILMRRKMDMNKALEHFQAASAIEPGYCEPTYWQGLTMINLGQLAPGLQKLEEALSCKYVAANSLKTLNAMIQILVSAEPANPKPLTMWGGILLRSEVWQPHSGCGALETAAALSAKKMDGPQAAVACDSCIGRVQDALKKLQGGTDVQLGGLVETEKKEVSEEVQSLRRLLSCVSARKQVYISLGNYGPKSKKARQALYGYVSHVGKEAPWCRSPVSEAKDMGEEGLRQSQPHNPHLQIIHSVQSQDAEDPHLQVEWGETILLQGRLQEAALHVNAGGMLFSMIADSAAKEAAAVRSKKKSGSKEVITRAVPEAKADELMRTNLEGKRLSQRMALALAAESYDRAADLVMPLQVPTSDQPATIDLTEGGCEMRLKALDARLVILEVMLSNEMDEDLDDREESTMRAMVKDGLRRVGALTSCTSGNNGQRLAHIKRRWDSLQ
jgi:tetratricopeptide (TPR) repeat protein